jgi:aryl-alcohol dehydrogenase-like predicted oxidoreductase
MFESTDPRTGARLTVRRDSHPHSVREELERSLRRLGVEEIDLLQVHHRDLDTPVAETMGALADLQRQGKIRAIGVSNYTLSEIQLAIAALKPLALASIQLEYNLLERGIEREILGWARDQGVSVLAYSPLAHGTLAGRQLSGRPLPADWRRGGAYFYKKNLALVTRGVEATVQPIGLDHGESLGTVSLAWLLAQPGLSGVVAGASTPAQAVDNARAAELALSDTEIARIRSAFAGFDRAPPRPRWAVPQARSLVSKVVRVVRKAKQALPLTRR